MERLIDISIDKLKRRVIKLCSVTDELVINSTLSILENRKDLIENVEIRYNEIAKYEKKINTQVVKLLALNHPVAKDLRKVLSAMRITANLQRIGDLSLKVSKFSREIIYEKELFEHIQCKEIFLIVSKMMKSSLDAYINEDTEQLNIIFNYENNLDQLVRTNSNRLIKLTEGNSASAENYIKLYTVINEIERIGDLTTNIVEEILFIQKS